MKKTQHILGRGLLCGLALTLMHLGLPRATAADTNEMQGQFSNSDFKFAKAAACGGAYEVNLGRVAAEKSTNSAVQQFAQRMVTDHGKANTDLQQIASRKGANLPSEPSADEQKEIDRLNKLTGTDFDKAYVNQMVKAHKEDQKEFQKASEKADDSDLKGFAANTLPVIQDHLRMAEDLENSLKHNLSMNTQ